MNNGLPEDNRQILVELAEAVKRLQDSDDWKLIIDEGFFKAFAITNAYNSWSFDAAARGRFLEKTISRGHLTKYLDDILDDGNNAFVSLREEQNED